MAKPSPVVVPENQVTCIVCQAKCYSVSDLDICAECFPEYCNSYIAKRQAVIEEWQRTNPAPLFICPDCGDSVRAVQNYAWAGFEGYCNYCSTVQMNRYTREASKRPKPRQSGIVYFATNGTRIKIGKSRNVPKRIEVLGIDLIHSICVTDYHQAELFFHSRFEPYRVIGEWFELPPITVNWIKGLQSDGMTITDLDGVKIWSAGNA